MINHHLADVITQSFGATEQTFTNATDLLDLRSAFMNAAANGVTVLASSGDDGVGQRDARRQRCYPFPADSAGRRSDPLVTVDRRHPAVPGPGRQPDQAPDTVWNDAYGAAGGGVSAVFSAARLPVPGSPSTGTGAGTAGHLA